MRLQPHLPVWNTYALEFSDVGYGKGLHSFATLSDDAK
jgi:hypothetical protein